MSAPCGAGSRRPLPGRSGHAEHGFATVVVTGLVAVLVATALAVTWLGSALEASHRAAGAADLAALAAAQAHQHGEDACAASRVVAAANDTRPLSCSLVGDDVTVEVEAQVRAVAGIRVVPSITRTARAGPSQLAAG